jgi:uncharacterized protein with HEPN domain
LIELFLFDIIVAISKIEYAVSKFDNPNDLKHDFMAWDSVIREFEIIGEASKHLLKSELLAEDYRSVVDFRNVLIHGYFGIDEDEVWSIVSDGLPPFKRLIASKIYETDITLKEEILDELTKENSHLEFVVKELEALRIHN